MYKLAISFFLLLVSLGAVSQMPVLNWAITFNEDNIANYRVGNNGRTVAVDGQGNVFSAGLFQYAVDFDPGPGVYSLTGGGTGSYGIYISKLDSNANFVWAVQLPTHVEFGQIELKIDLLGNIYLASDLRDVADMDPGPGVHMMSPTGFRDAFVIKLDNDGNFIWAKQFGGPGDTGPQATILELDSQNNVILAGIFNNTVDFDPGPGTMNLSSPGYFQAFIAKLNTNGELIWAKPFGTSYTTYGGSSIKDIESDAAGNIYTIGGFAGTVDFNPGAGTYNVTGSTGSISDGFICKLDANCNFIWVKTIGQVDPITYNGLISPIGIAIDNMNNIVTCGYFIGNFDFDPGTAVQNVSSNPHESYILKLDPQGNFIWVKTIGSPSETDSGNDVMVDSNNDVYLIGSFGRSVDFDPGPGVHIINSPHYGAEAVVKLTANGNFRFAAPFQSISYGSGLFRRMEMDSDRNIYVTGYVGGEMDFDPGPGVFPLYGSMDWAPFVVKLSRCVGVTSSTLTVASCDSFILNNQIFHTSGTYEQIIPNAIGCDSIITLHLTINKKVVEQTRTICDGEYFFVGGGNQTTAGIYYDTLQTVSGCDSVIITNLLVNPKPLPDLGPDRILCSGAQSTLNPGTFVSYLWQDNSTSPSYTANNPGVYWVRVSNSFNCVATDSLLIIAIADPPVDFLPPKDSICKYETLDIVSSQTFTSYLWSTGSIEKNIQVQRPGIYYLRVTDANGCTGTDTTIVYEKQCMTGVYIPTAFSPDNNGRNDIFRAMVFGRLVQFRLTVYNRWGQIVFQTTDPDKGWNGKSGNITNDTGVFVWVCNYQVEGGEFKSEKGTVTLIR